MASLALLNVRPLFQHDVRGPGCQAVKPQPLNLLDLVNNKAPTAPALLEESLPPNRHPSRQAASTYATVGDPDADNLTTASQKLFERIEVRTSLSILMPPDGSNPRDSAGEVRGSQNI
jgi:hypothetical protein